MQKNFVHILEEKASLLFSPKTLLIIQSIVTTIDSGCVSSLNGGHHDEWLYRNFYNRVVWSLGFSGTSHWICRSSVYGRLELTLSVLLNSIVIMVCVLQEALTSLPTRYSSWLSMAPSEHYGAMRMVVVWRYALSFLILVSAESFLLYHIQGRKIQVFPCFLSGFTMVHRFMSVVNHYWDYNS